MDRNQFRQEFNDIDNHDLSDSKGLDRMETLSHIALSHDTLSHSIYGKGLTSVVIAMEEMSELQKELSKIIRNKQDYYGILEEMADVIIMIYRIRTYLNIDETELIRAINIKLNILEQRMKREEEEIRRSENGTES